MRLTGFLPRMRQPSPPSQSNGDVLRPISLEIESSIPPEDMIQACFDRPAIAPPQALLLILSTERSGSTLLCEQLAALDHCYAHEYFQVSQYMQILARRWAFTDGDRIDWSRFAAALRANRTAPSGILGINVHARHLVRFERAAPHLADLPIHYIHVTRRDILAQALSFDEARQTGQWSSHFPSSAQAEYRYESARRALAEIQTDNARITAYLALKGATPLPVVYEDHVASPIPVLRAITGLTESAIADVLNRDRPTATRRQGSGAMREQRKLLFAAEFMRECNEAR